MEKYDYRENVLEDVREYISNNYTREELKSVADDLDELGEKLYDIMWTADSVTGNGSGSYTFNAWQAEENLCHNLDLIREVSEEFGELDLASPESCDVSIRCYYLGECINEVLNEDYSDLYEEDVDEDDITKTNEEIAHEIVQGIIHDRGCVDVVTDQAIHTAALTTAKLKDDQFVEEKKTLIDKATNFIAENMKCNGYTLQTKAKFIKEFRNYMKGEDDNE